jgi:hypothetical protein
MEATKSSADKSAVAARLARVHMSKLETLNMLERFHKGVGPNRDADLVKACARIRHKICELNQSWLPKFLFKQPEGALFHVDGDSTAILYNYIPETDRNVFAVYERNVLVNYTGLQFRLRTMKAVDIPTDCEFICMNAKIFNTDIVSTHDSFLAEVYAQRIDFYSKHKR